MMALGLAPSRKMELNSMASPPTASMYSTPKANKVQKTPAPRWIP